MSKLLEEVCVILRIWMHGQVSLQGLLHGILLISLCWMLDYFIYEYIKIIYLRFLGLGKTKSEAAIYSVQNNEHT